MFGRLYITERGYPDRAVELRGAVTIGRTNDNDIVLASDGVSHVHAMLLAQASGVTLLDLGSTFGTFVDSAQALPDAPVSLADGAQISIGRATLRYAAPHVTRHLSSDAPPALATPYLNTRFEGLQAGDQLQIGRAITLLVWVGAPLLSDERQSSRPLELPRTSLETPTALRVRVRAVSRAWSIAAEQPILLAAAWGSAQIARYQLAARRAERSKLAITLEHHDTHTLVQQCWIGLLATSPKAQSIHIPGAATADLSQAWTRCHYCGATIRARALYCTQCGRRRW